MNILFLARLFHPHIGGVETHVLELSKQLIKKGHQISVITEGYDENLSETQTYQGIKIYRIPLHDIKPESKKYAIWEWLFSHQSLLKNAEIIHIHDVAYWIFPFFWLFSKTFTTFHGYEGSKPPGKSAIFQRKLAKRFFRKTLNVGGFMEKWYGFKPNELTYGAVSSINAAITKKSNRAVYIGRLHEDTGIMTYLKAMYAANKLQQDIGLDIYGDGPQINKAKEYAQKYQLDVKFYGFVKNASSRLSRYKLAFVSRYLSLLEAMRVGIPIVSAYNNQIKKDYLDCHPMRENFFASDDPQKIAVQLIKLQKLSTLEKLKITRAQQWAKKQTWPKMTGLYQTLWKT